MNTLPLGLKESPVPHIWSYWCVICLERTDTAMTIANHCARCGSVRLETSKEEAAKINNSIRILS